jgi:hypothetical protein
MKLLQTDREPLPDAGGLNLENFGRQETFSAIHRPPLAFLFPLQRGEAERRQTQIQPPRLRTARAQRSAHACRRSTTALT